MEKRLSENIVVWDLETFPDPNSKATLNELSRIMGLPGKPEGIAGGEVERYVREARIKEVANYCETDVVKTYRIWLRYELFRGALIESELKSSEQKSIRVHTGSHRYETTSNLRQLNLTARLSGLVRQETVTGVLPRSVPTERNQL